MLFRVSDSLVNIDQFLKINETDQCAISQPALSPYFGDRKLLLLNLASHGQNRTDFFGQAVEDRFGGR
jgi:hypothetical protein